LSISYFLLSSDKYVKVARANALDGARARTTSQILEEGARVKITGCTG